MRPQTPYEIVKMYHQAWTTGDIETAMTMIADDIVCQAPGITLDGKASYRDFIAGFAPRLTGIGEIAEFADGNHVVLFYYPQTAITSSTPCAEYFTVSDGQIVSSILIFDRLSYTPATRD